MLVNKPQSEDLIGYLMSEEMDLIYDMNVHTYICTYVHIRRMLKRRR
jgi:hypothetical protein